MFSGRFKYLVLAISLAVLLSPIVSSSGQQGGTPAGLILQIQGYGIYKDDTGLEHRTTSEVISLIVQTIALLDVSPNETEPSLEVQPHQEFTRVFQVCNGGNHAERVTISRADVSAPARLIGLFFDIDASGTISSADLAIRLGETLSPDLAPEGCAGVLVRANSEDFPSRTNLPIRLTARTTADAANGIQEATGQVMNTVIDGAQITGPDTDLPLLLVNASPQSVATANQVLNFTLNVRNSGDSPAQGAVFVDDLPEGLEFVSGSAKLDAKTSGAVSSSQTSSVASRVEISIPSMASGDSAQLQFQVRVTSKAPAGRGLVNTGQITGLNFAPVATAPTATVWFVIPSRFMIWDHCLQTFRCLKVAAWRSTNQSTNRMW